MVDFDALFPQLVRYTSACASSIAVLVVTRVTPPPADCCSSGGTWHAEPSAWVPRPVVVRRTCWLPSAPACCARTCVCIPLCGITYGQILMPALCQPGWEPAGCQAAHLACKGLYACVSYYAWGQILKPPHPCASTHHATRPRTRSPNPGRLEVRMRGHACMQAAARITFRC